MNFVSNVFSTMGVNAISTMGRVIDDLVSSDEELALTDIEKDKIKTAYQIKMQELVVQLDKQAADQEQLLEKSLTERLQLDMTSDSWLSKNIRPITLIFMTLVVSVLAFATIFASALSKGQLDTIQSWIPFFQMIMLTIYGFYFGSRGFEKIQQIRSTAQIANTKKTLVL